MKRLALLIIIIVVMGIVFFVSPMFTVISFTETRTNNPQMYYINVFKDKNFEIRYTHSIHLTDVLETYTITKSRRLKLVSMEYEDVAVGMPAHAEEGQTLTYENGKYKLEYENTTMDQFTLYIGNIDLDLYVNYGDKNYNLKKSLKRGNSYVFEVKKVSLYDKLKGVVMKNEDR